VIRYLTLRQLLRVVDRAVAVDAPVRDYGLLESALARPQATVFGQDAYPSIHAKAAALLHSLCTNHGLVDGNKRLAFAAAVAFLRFNGEVVDLSQEDGYALTMSVADGSLSDVEKIAERLRG